MNYESGNKLQSDTLIGSGKISLNPATGKPQNFKDKPCKQCGGSFKPVAPSHLYCCQECADKAFTTGYLKRNYNMTYEEYETLYEEQDGLCKICGSEGFQVTPQTET